MSTKNNAQIPKLMKKIPDGSDLSIRKSKHLRLYLQFVKSLCYRVVNNFKLIFAFFLFIDYLLSVSTIKLLHNIYYFVY